LYKGYSWKWLIEEGDIIYEGYSREDKKSLYAWDIICKENDNCSLAIINFQVQNKALLLKHLYKFYKNEGFPSSVQLIRDAYYYNIVHHLVKICDSFTWRSIIGMSTVFKAMS
jgi:hypothetical protein